LPERAAWHPRERVAVIADLHLGYEWTRGRLGDLLPEHSLAESYQALDALLARGRIERLVVGGDLTESFVPCRLTERDVRRLVDWLRVRGIELIRVAGNHDRVAPEPLQRSVTVAGWTIAHGHEWLNERPLISGHHHPILRWGSITAPCFVVQADSILLPAFSGNAAGLDVATARLPAVMDRKARCVAIAGEELLDFGPLGQLRARLGGSVARREPGRA